MKSAKELKTFLQGSGINAEEYTEMVNIIGEERADNYVNSQKPKSPTVGFANPFTVSSIDKETGKVKQIKKLTVKLAFNPTQLENYGTQVVDGWVHIIATMNPNGNGIGFHVGEDFVETFQEANTRKRASKNDNGFILIPFLPMSSNDSEVPQDANSSKPAFQFHS